MQRLFADELLDVCGHGIAKNRGGAKISLALCGLIAEVMTMIGVIHLDLSRSGNGKSFSGRLMRFDLTHCNNPFG